MIRLCVATRFDRNGHLQSIWHYINVNNLLLHKTVPLDWFWIVYSWVCNDLSVRCRYNVTLRRVHETTVAVDKYYIFWVCVCKITYPACKAHAPYCHLRPVWLYHIFPHYLINGKIFLKLLNIKCVLWFSLQVLSVKFLILRRSHEVVVTKVHNVFMSIDRYYSKILIIL